MFHDSGYISSNDLALFTDSSSTGFGGYYKTANQFFMDTWDNYPYPVSDRSFSYLELFPILVSCWIWGKKWQRRRIMFISDNEGTVAIINNGKSKCPHINSLLRKMVVLSTLCNFTFHSMWISTKQNIEADLLSRQKLSSFQDIAPTATRISCPPAHHITLCKEVLLLLPQSIENTV